MKKRLSLLLAVLFVASTIAVAPVFATDDYDDKDDDKKVCVLHKKKEFIWISKEGFYNGHKKHGDKIVPDKYCKDKKDDDKDDDKDDKKY